MKDEGPLDLDPRDDGYLCDRIGEASPDIRRWETLLAEFRQAAPIPPVPEVTTLRRSGPKRRLTTALALAASLLLAAAVTIWHRAPPSCLGAGSRGRSSRVEGIKADRPAALAVRLPG